MTSVDIDESLREQSKLLLRKLKEKQSRLQNAVSTSKNDNQVTESVRGENSGLKMRTLKDVSDWQGTRQVEDGSRGTTCLKEKLDSSLQKSVPAKSSREGRARLQRRRTRSKDEKQQLVLRRNPATEENKENLEHGTHEKYLKSKSIETTDDNCISDRVSVDQTHGNARELDSEKVNSENIESDTRGAETPNTVRRRKIIDKNIKVNGTADLNVSELMREVEEEYPRLNYSYSNVEDTDLKFLQERFGSGAEKKSDTEDVPVKDAGPDVREKYSDNLENPGNSRKFAKYIRDSKKPKSILLNTSQRSNKSTTGNNSKVSFRSPTRDSSSRNLSYQMDPESRRNQRMLGYDWIAALMDNDPNGVNQSETFFDELKEFRSLNLDECVNQMYMTGPQELWEHPEREPSPVQKALEETRPLDNTEVKPYMVNDRLFAEPIKRSLFADYDYEEPRRTEKEGTYEEPRFVRVSIPRSTLLPPHRVKPHRRNSFESADSMALSQHCLKGWNTSDPATMPAASNIGLRNATLGVNPTMKTTLADAETLAANYPYEWDPADQSILQPLPRPTFRPETSYMDSSWPAHIRNDQSSFNNSSATLKKATDDLLNSTYSLMYEMQRLKTQRSDDPIRP